MGYGPCGCKELDAIEATDDMHASPTSCGCFAVVSWKRRIYIFLAQRQNVSLLHCQADSLPLSHMGSHNKHVHSRKMPCLLRFFWSNSQVTLNLYVIQGQSAYWLGCVLHWYISKEFFMEAINFWTSSILPPLFKEVMIPPTDPCPFKEIILNSRALSRNLLF